MNENFKNFIAKRIKQGLKESKISQTQLASMINKSRAYVTNIIQGRYTPKISELLRISECLKKPIGYFFGEDTPGLMHYVDKAKKWDKMVSLIERDIKTDFDNDVLSIPLIDTTKVANKSMKELFDLKKQTKKFIYLSDHYIRNILKYYNPVDNLSAITIFIRDYPEFGINIGDILVLEEIVDNDIKDDSGKLFPIIYKNELGIKRIYKDGNEYYLEPMHSNPQIERISIDDPHLIIPGRVVFTIQTKMF